MMPVRGSTGLEEDIYVEIDSEDGAEPAPAWFESVVRDVLDAEGVAPPYEVSVILTGQETVHQMNRQYRNVDAPTDVIAFYTEEHGTDAGQFVLPGDGIRRLGDIVISFPQAVEQAHDEGHSVEKELSLLVIHGLLHLLGYDHETPEDAPCMRRREAALLEELKGRHYD
jgi:probable rRNA maturation factor